MGDVQDINERIKSLETRIQALESEIKSQARSIQHLQSGHEALHAMRDWLMKLMNLG